MDYGSDTIVPTTSAQVATPIMAQTPVMPTTVPISVSLGEKPKKFNGLNFKRWQQKMLFYLKTFNLARFLMEELRSSKKMSVISKSSMLWMLGNIMTSYAGTVMNALTNSLYFVYTDKKTTKVLWESLDRKYKTEDVRAKNFVVGRFLDYKMVDSKTMISQVQELQVILHEIHVE